MGRPEKEGRCKKHPIHKNLNGVCPYCLRDKLANISVSSSSSTNNAASSTSSASSIAYSSYDSDVSSSVASPVPKAQYEERNNKKRIFGLLKGRKKTLKSSFSFSLTKEVKKKGKEEKRKSNNGAGKLWAKLVMGRSTLAHSMTVKESSSSSKWTFFRGVNF